MGDVHGGVVATLIDNAAWFTAAVRYEAWLVTVELGVRLLDAPDCRHLTAIGRVVKAGARIGVAEAEVRTPGGALIAVGSGTFTPTSRWLDET